MGWAVARCRPIWGFPHGDVYTKTPYLRLPLCGLFCSRHYIRLKIPTPPARIEPRSNVPPSPGLKRMYVVTDSKMVRFFLWGYINPRASQLKAHPGANDGFTGLPRGPRAAGVRRPCRPALGASWYRSWPRRPPSASAARLAGPGSPRAATLCQTPT